MLFPSETLVIAQYDEITFLFIMLNGFDSLAYDALGTNESMG